MKSLRVIFCTWVNKLNQKLIGQKILLYHQTPSQPTGELFGLDYLRRQAEFLIGDEASVRDDMEVDEDLGRREHDLTVSTVHLQEFIHFYCPS